MNPWVNKIEVVEYDPRWPDYFKEISGIVAGALGDLVRRIEHVGSTSVPGLAAKPVIDIDVVIETREQLSLVIERLAPLGYSHLGDLGIVSREAFRRADEQVPWDGSGRTWIRQNLYVVAQDARELVRHTAFRDYLRAHPEAVAEYARLKRGLAQAHTYDIDSYVEGKTAFIEGIYRQLFGPTLESPGL